jgi:bis(5'-nucleosyl)-tetraphosphatase (symmetrical)
LQVLTRLRGFGDAATCLLGNHDLHLLAVCHGARKPSRKDTLDSIVQAPDRDAWVEWLRHRKLADLTHGWLTVHAGVVPQWSVAETLRLAGEVQAMIQGPQLADFLKVMYGNQPARWDPGHQGSDRWRYVVNVLTRIRFCTADGVLDFESKDGAATAPDGYLPWFAHVGRETAGHGIAFGHWSTLGLVVKPDLLALDTGCVWGGALTAVRVDGGRCDVFQVRCDQAQAPGQD